MKAKINSKLLLAALKDASPAYEPNHLIPIMTMACLRFDKDHCRLCVSSNNLTILKNIEASADDEFMVLIEYDKLKNVCEAVEDGPLIITPTEKQVSVSFGKDVFKMGKPTDSALYPKIQDFEVLEEIDADGSFFWGLGKNPGYLMDDDYNSLRNICIDLTDGKAFTVSSNNHNMFVNRSPVQHKNNLRCVIDKSFAMAIKGIQSGKVQFGEKKISVVYPGTKIISVVSDPVYVQYPLVLERKPKVNCIVPRADIYSALNKVIAMKSALRFHGVYMTLKPGKMEFYFYDIDTEEEARSEIDAVCDLDMKLHFNAKALRQTILDLPPNCKSVALSFINLNTVVFIEDEEDDSVTVSITPLAYNNA